MSEDAEVFSMPDRSHHVTADEIEIVPMRSRAEMLKEAALITPNLLRLLFGLLRDPRVPLRRKWVAVGIGAYVVSPLDIIPDVIPVVGKLDDLLLVVFAIYHLLEGASDDVLADHWAGSEDALDLVSGLIEFGAELLPEPVRRVFDA